MASSARFLRGLDLARLGVARRRSTGRALHRLLLRAQEETTAQIAGV